MPWRQMPRLPRVRIHLRNLGMTGPFHIKTRHRSSHRIPSNCPKEDIGCSFMSSHALPRLPRLPSACEHVRPVDPSQVRFCGGRYECAGDLRGDARGDRSDAGGLSGRMLDAGHQVSLSFWHVPQDRGFRAHSLRHTLAGRWDHIRTPTLWRYGVCHGATGRAGGNIKACCVFGRPCGGCSTDHAGGVAKTDRSNRTDPQPLFLFWVVLGRSKLRCV